MSFSIKYVRSNQVKEFVVTKAMVSAVWLFLVVRPGVYSLVGDGRI